MTNPFLDLIRRAQNGGTIDRADIVAITTAIRGACDGHGRVTSRLQRAFFSFEGFADALTPGAQRAFQQMAAEAGARMRGAIQLPEENTPYWQLGTHPLADLQTSRQLPANADVVVIGAGLTGASTAWHLASAARRTGLRTVVLEHGDPATQASGRNGGNFELMPENFLGEYEGLPAERRKWLKRRFPQIQPDDLRQAGDAQARAILEFGARNAALFLNVVHREKIDCDLSESGWIRIADTAAEERGIREEVAFAQRIGVPLRLLSPEELFRECGIRAKHAGRKAMPNGNYHPFKFVCGLLDRAMRKGVQLFARTPVVGFRATRGGDVQLETPRGRISARRVVFATNAFTSLLLPELDDIRYFQSQILNMEHVRDTIRGMTVTEKKGDLYYNFPKARKYIDDSGTPRGMLLAGGGLDRPGTNPFDLRRSSAILDLVLSQVTERFGETAGQPPSRVWTGPMAFTPDRLPAIGFFRRAGFPPNALIVAAGFNGYGGTYCVETGRLAAQMAVTGRTPDEAQPSMFSPDRFTARF